MGKGRHGIDSIVILARNFGRRIQNLLRSRDVLILLLIFLFHALTNYLFLRIDQFPFVLADDGYLILSKRYLHAFGALDFERISSILFDTTYPPLHRWVALPFYAFFGVSEDVAIMTTSVFSLITIFSTYSIGKTLYDRKVGLIAPAVLILLPGFFGFSRTFYSEPSLMAMVTLSIALLLKSSEFSDRNISIWIGISIGLGLLAKYSFTLYVLGPFLLMFTRTLRTIKKEWEKNRQKARKRAINLCLMGLAGGVICLWWYLPSILHILDHYVFYQFTDHTLDTLPYLEGLRAYVTLIVHRQLMVLFTTVLGFGVIYALVRHGRSSQILFAWILLPLFTFPLISGYLSARFILPLLPALGILIALGTMPFLDFRPWLGASLLLSLLLFGSFQMVMLAYNPEMPNNLLPGLSEKISDSRVWRAKGILDNGRIYAHTEDWHADLFKSFTTQPPGSNIVLGFIGNEECGVTQRFSDIALFPGIDDDMIEVRRLLFACFNGHTHCDASIELMETAIEDVDVIIFAFLDWPIGNLLDPSYEDTCQEMTHNRFAYEKLLAAWQTVGDQFTYIESLGLPSGNALQIYSKTLSNITMLPDS